VTGADQRFDTDRLKTGARDLDPRTLTSCLTGEEKKTLLRGNVCAYLTVRLMGDPNLPSRRIPALILFRISTGWRVTHPARAEVPRDERRWTARWDLSAGRRALEAPGAIGAL